MKTTKRVIKIPASRSNNKFLFQPIDRIDIMFPFDIDDLQRKPIESTVNPLACMNDFRKKSWADEIILLLKPWINEDNFKGNFNMAAKFAYHNKVYSECLKFLLEDLTFQSKHDQLYVTHTPIEQYENEKNGAQTPQNKEELRRVIKNVMSKRIKEVSMSILNEESYPLIDPLAYKALPCCCEELNYRKKKTSLKSLIDISDDNISTKAAQVIDKCISTFPVDSELWEVCFRYAKDFYLDHNLPISDLETVLRKYMESNATTMAAAIMFSNDCAQYSKILSPKFYLNMCSQVLDTWG